MCFNDEAETNAEAEAEVEAEAETGAEADAGAVDSLFFLRRGEEKRKPFVGLNSGDGENRSREVESSDETLTQSSVTVAPPSSEDLTRCEKVYFEVPVPILGFRLEFFRTLIL